MIHSDAVRPASLRTPLRRLPAACLALLLLLPAGSARAQQAATLPDTPAGRHAAAVLEVLRGGDTAAVSRLVRERMAAGFQEMPMAAHQREFARMRRTLAGGEVVDVASPGPSSVQVSVRTPAGLRTLLLEVEEVPPHRISGVRAEEARPPVRLRGTTVAEVEGELARLAAEDRFSGVVLVARGDSVLLHRAFGPADREAGIANRTDTRFDLGSINKLFTATAILRLAQDGKLDLDAPMGRYLRGFPAPAADRVTVRQLLQMRSGYTDYSHAPGFRRDVKRFGTIGDFVELIRPFPLAFEPGTREAYSNAGYELLAGIVESATGRSFYDVVQDLVLRPAGMESTDYSEHVRRPGFAVPYSRTGGRGRWTDVLGEMTVRGSGSGGAHATAEDLRRFYAALFAGRLLDRAHTDLLLHRFEPGKSGPVQQFGFAGGMQGVSAAMAARPEAGDLVVVLANRDEPVAEETAAALTGWLDRRTGRSAGVSPAPAVEPQPLDRADPRAVRATGLAERVLAGRREDAVAYLRAHAAPEQAAAVQGQLEAVLGSLTPGALEIAATDGGPGGNVFLPLRPRAGGSPTRALVVTVEPAAPHRITGVRVIAIRIE